MSTLASVTACPDVFFENSIEEPLFPRQVGELLRRTLPRSALAIECRFERGIGPYWHTSCTRAVHKVEVSTYQQQLCFAQQQAKGSIMSLFSQAGVRARARVCAWEMQVFSCCKLLHCLRMPLVTPSSDLWLACLWQVTPVNASVHCSK